MGLEMVIIILAIPSIILAAIFAKIFDYFEIDIFDELSEFIWGALGGAIGGGVTFYAIADAIRSGTFGAIDVTGMCCWGGFILGAIIGVFTVFILLSQDLL
jgi:hypothetical protein